MKNSHFLFSRYFRPIALLLLLLHPLSYLSIQATETSGILRAEKVNPTTVDVLFTNNQRMTIDFYGENIFRIFQDNSGGIIRDPEAKPEAQILVDQPAAASISLLSLPLSLSSPLDRLHPNQSIHRS